MADLGAHQADPTPNLNYVALQACAMVAGVQATNAGTQGERDWFDYMAYAFPGMNGEHQDLFDAAITVVCPDLGYEPGYDHTANTGGNDGQATEPLPDAPPGTPGWHFIECGGALAVAAVHP